MNSLPLLAASLLAVAATGSTSELEVLPSGHPVVQVGIDGRPYRFVIDTAASATAVSAKAIAAAPQSFPAAGTGVLGGVSGMSNITLVKLANLQVLGRSFEAINAVQLPASSVDKLNVDGILGADVFSRSVLDLDVLGRRWGMSDLATPEQLQGLGRPLPFTLTAGRAPLINVTLDGVTLPAVVDTGAKTTIINWAAARSLGFTPDSPGLVAGEPVKGATAGATASVVRAFRGLKVGDAQFKSKSIRIADVPVFGILGFKPDQPAMILGIDMFADRRILIDYKKQTLRTSPPRSTRAG